jgi:hypothetical protein
VKGDERREREKGRKTKGSRALNIHLRFMSPQFTGSGGEGLFLFILYIYTKTPSSSSSESTAIWLGAKEEFDG